MREHVYTIRQKDVGQLLLSYMTCTHCGVRAHINVTNLMGRILPIDIGKRIYKVSRATGYHDDDGITIDDNTITGGTYQVENQEQLEKRLNS